MTPPSTLIPCSSATPAIGVDTRNSPLLGNARPDSVSARKGLSEFSGPGANRRDIPDIAGEMVVTGTEDAKEAKLKSIDDLVEYFLDAGKKGVAINRYKGLGEMNPDQLWHTTLDANERSLLQVKIKEVDEADDIFTKLMGDVVEPRREFIQDNSLTANVDV